MKKLLSILIFIIFFCPLVILSGQTDSVNLSFIQNSSLQKEISLMIDFIEISDDFDKENTIYLYFEDFVEDSYDLYSTDLKLEYIDSYYFKNITSNIVLLTNVPEFFDVTKMYSKNDREQISIYFSSKENDNIIINPISTFSYHFEEDTLFLDRILLNDICSFIKVRHGIYCQQTKLNETNEKQIEE